MLTNFFTVSIVHSYNCKENKVYVCVRCLCASTCFLKKEMMAPLCANGKQ